MFSQLKSEVSIMTGVIASAIMLLNGLHEKLDSALATAQENGDLSEMQELTDALKDQTSQLASAVAANTIADPNAGSVGLTPSPEALGSADVGDADNAGSVGEDTNKSEGDASGLDGSAEEEESSAGSGAAETEVSLTAD